MKITLFGHKICNDYIPELKKLKAGDIIWRANSIGSLISPVEGSKIIKLHGDKIVYTDGLEGVGQLSIAKDQWEDIGKYTATDYVAGWILTTKYEDYVNWCKQFDLTIPTYNK